MNEFSDAREQLPSAIGTLPRRLREGNAAQLLAIVEELRRSFVVELQVAQRVGRVDVANPEAVRVLREGLEDYADLRVIERDRTHCRNIERIARELRASEEPAEFERLAALIEPLAHADYEYLDELEHVVNDALVAIREIEAVDRLEDARAAQDRYRERKQADVARVKATLRQMNTLAEELIDLA